MRLKSVGNNGALQAKSINFKGLVFIPNKERLLPWNVKQEGKYQSIFRWSQNGKSRSTESSNLSGEECFLHSAGSKTW